MVATLLNWREERMSSSIASFFRIRRQFNDVRVVRWFVEFSGTSAWIYPREEMFLIVMSQARNWEVSDTWERMVREAIMTCQLIVRLGRRIINKRFIKVP